MSDHNNRLFHWMGPKKILWIHERDLKMYPSPDDVGMVPNVCFLVQHAVHGTWTMGMRRKNLTIEWTQVIVVKPSITAEVFKAATGREPEIDDLERCNCSHAGEEGHYFCGWDKSNNCPQFMSAPVINSRRKK